MRRDGSVLFGVLQLAYGETPGRPCRGVKLHGVEISEAVAAIAKLIAQRDGGPESAHA